MQVESVRLRAPGQVFGGLDKKKSTAHIARQGNMMAAKKAMSLVELLVGLTILAVIWGAVSMNAEVSKQTAQREAEKVHKFLTSLILRADAKRQNFNLGVQTNEIQAYFGSETFGKLDASPGCSYEWNAPSGSLTYYPSKGNFNNQGATITVKGRKGPYYVIIAVIGGRIRISSDSTVYSEEK